MKSKIPFFLYWVERGLLLFFADYIERQRPKLLN